MKKILWGFIMILISLSLVKTDNTYAYKQIINSNDLNLIRAIDIYKERYLEYLKGKMSEEEALDVIIKGFMITDYKTI